MGTSIGRRASENGEHTFTTEAAFIRASEDLLRNAWRGFVSATLADGQSCETNRRYGL